MRVIHGLNDKFSVFRGSRTSKCGIKTSLANAWGITPRFFIRTDTSTFLVLPLDFIE